MWCWTFLRSEVLTAKCIKIVVLQNDTMLPSALMMEGATQNWLPSARLDAVISQETNVNWTFISTMAQFEQPHSDQTLQNTVS